LNRFIQEEGPRVTEAGDIWYIYQNLKQYNQIYIYNIFRSKYCIGIL